MVESSRLLNDQILAGLLFAPHPEEEVWTFPFWAARGVSPGMDTQ